MTRSALTGCLDLGTLSLGDREGKRISSAGVFLLAMLASIPQMETVRSLPRNRDMVARHPSAEDLDAAQQLISSAQAGREHLVDRSRDDDVARGYDTYDAYERKHTPTYDAERPTLPSTESASNPLAERTSPKSQKDTSFLGHSCR